MCHFHVLLAQNIATNNGTDQFDPTVNLLAYVASNRYRITDVSPDLTGVMGKDQAQMASEKIQNAYKATVLPQDPDVLKSTLEFAMVVIRAGIENVVEDQGLTPETLALPSDPAQHIKFGNAAVDSIFLKPGPVFALQPDTIAGPVAPLQKAIQTLVNDPRIDEALQLGFHHMVGTLIIDAPSQVEAAQAATQTLKRDFDCCNQDITTDPLQVPVALPAIKRQPE